MDADSKPLGKSCRWRGEDCDPDQFRNDTDLLLRILMQHSEREREALFRFYLHRVPEAVIEKDLGVAPGHLRRLRRSTKAAFIEQRKAQPYR